MSSILGDFANAVARHPDRTAIVDGKGRETTFAQLKTRADHLANAWYARGIRPGDRVLLAMTLNADLYASLAALWTLGATVVLPEPAMGLAGLRHAARVSQATAFCSSGMYGMLKIALPELWSLRHLRPHGPVGGLPDLAPPSENDIALISFTSGTSGAPKAIPRSHGFMTAQHHAIAPLLCSAVAERDLVAFPVFVLINIANGQTSVLPNWKMTRLAQLRPSQLENWLTQNEITRALLPPALCEKLIKTRMPQSFHRVFTGGGPVFPDILAGLKSAKSDLEIVCVYGSTEAEPIAHLNAAEITSTDHIKMENGHGLLVGTPVRNISVRIADNEILVAGAHVNGGYLNAEHDVENKIPDGSVIWHRTGDAGYIDDLKRLWLLGRLGSQVETTDGPLYPFSAEVAARQWQGVTQCALMTTDQGACLAVEGDTKYVETWRTQASRLNIPRIIPVARIPMDKRHASKVDRSALAKIVNF